MLLLVAMIAAVALTLRRRKDSRYQNPSEQVRAKPAERMRLVKIAPVVEVASEARKSQEGSAA
jgi:NADH-quinone oxidoreductase subunit J